MYIWSKQDVDNTLTIVCTGSTIRTQLQYYTTTVLVNYVETKEIEKTKILRKEITGFCSSAQHAQMPVTACKME